MLSLLTHSAFAAIPSLSPTTNGISVLASASPKVPFFKSPQSLFPSGAMSQETLRKVQVRAQMTNEKFYKYKNQLFKVDELRPVRPVHLSKYVIDPSSRVRLKVIDISVGVATVLNERTNKVEKRRLDELASDAYDLGNAITLTDVYLKHSPADDSKVITTIPQGNSLTPISFKNGFALVRYKDYVGYARLSEMMTKFDFATLVFAKKEWQFVKRREFDWLITNENKKIHIGEVRGLVTPDQRGLIASMNQKIPLWSQVEVVHAQKPSWVESVLKGHGSVWWKPFEETADEILTIDEILKRKVASVSFHPKNPLKGIVSAQGVYLTEDGVHWKRMLQFEDFHGPVYYFNDILLFVGHFRSSDGGRTFDNYIQIDKIASAIEYSLGFFPKKLQVNKIDTLPPFRLKIEVDTGTKKIKMESPLFAQEWKVIRG